ncbi:leucyl aminopeptidase [Psychrobacillus psychrodurans]|uniref:Probable cytosol aminopeptidase n=1 Tax=Psychrobacillus psychrodurans TaxID=126157 RepID=A0A9X3LCU2_9BACI|nr:leucyl aminopeptidase [Psychrobacillus psychrodurans]MCZ8535210.1 leucyl aminopeptidase [Psychrobacillus psychrodurans]
MIIHTNEVLFEEVQSETLVVGVSKHVENTPKWDTFLNSFGEHIGDWVKSGDISTELKKIVKIPVSNHESVKRVLFVGIGDRKQLTQEKVREAFGLVGKELLTSKPESLAIWLPSFTSEAIVVADVAYLAAEGIGMGSFTYEGYKTTSNVPDYYLPSIELLMDEEDDEVVSYFEVGTIYADAVNEARILVNTPGNVLTSTQLGEYARELGETYGFETEILGKKEIEELGMGALLAVNQGSVEEPRLIALKYQATDDWTDVVGLVGKGITFDTGGYSIKTKTGIVGMKGDMGGAAAVLGAMQIIGELRPNKNVIAIIASTDNMISGNAFKPDDVITSMSGKTIEILNTDAEGRLVLADAVTYAKQQGANYIVDVATLTGGVITALGYDKTGALTNDEEFFETFMESSLETGEFVWRLPLTENDKKRIRKSDVADLNNSPGGDGHMIFGGGFVGEFVEETPWIHLDIAGTSDTKAAHDFGPKGGTGVMVRTLATLVERMADEE